MNILVVCPHFRPDVAPTGEVMSSIVEQFAEQGHRIHVITALPWYQGHRIDDGWRRTLSQTETVEWGWITRLHPFPTDKTNIPARAVAFSGFTVLATLAALRPRFRPDVVLTMSPPLIIGFAGWLAARRWRVPSVFNIQDVFPDVAVEVGAISNPRVIAAASAVERFLYRRADAVTVLSDDLRDNVAGKAGPAHAASVRVIPNFVDVERIRPQTSNNSYRDEFGLGDRRVVMYAGNLGYSQSVDLLIDVARQRVDDPSVVYVVNGSGSALEDLRARAEGLDNMVWVGMQPRDRVGEVLAAADVQLVLLREGLARSSVPSKLYSVMAAGRPVVASVDPGTEVDRTLTAAAAGVSVPPGDADALGAAIDAILADPEGGRAMGERARRYVEGWASPAAVARRYTDLFEELAGR